MVRQGQEVIHDLHACDSDDSVFCNRLEMVAVCCNSIFNLVDRKDEVSYSWEV